ncbi:MAG: hypothetical protein ACK5BJ_14300 [Bacteroidota bacterium]|jgi:hypothetical protein|nr:hypothetical protein [Cytophagales bacterium]
MRFIIRLKHWQLFLLTIGVPILADILGVSGHGQTGYADIIVGMITVPTVFSWIWTIPNGLYKLLPVGHNFRLWRFRVSFLLALTLLIFIFWLTENENVLSGDNFLILVFTGVPIYLGLMVYSVLFAAKTLKTIELGRLAKINEYALEAFLIWMVPLGVWFIQPRLNELAD